MPSAEQSAVPGAHSVTVSGRAADDISVVVARSVHVPDAARPGRLPVSASPGSPGGLAPAFSQGAGVEGAALRLEVQRWRAIIRETEPAPTPLTDELAAVVMRHMGPALDAVLRSRTESQPVFDAPRRTARPRAKAS